eukprot:2524635-Pyramimonas_sp.AAC.1
MASKPMWEASPGTATAGLGFSDLHSLARGNIRLEFRKLSIQPSGKSPSLPVSLPGSFLSLPRRQTHTQMSQKARGPLRSPAAF